MPMIHHIFYYINCLLQYDTDDADAMLMMEKKKYKKKRNIHKRAIEIIFQQ